MKNKKRMICLFLCLCLTGILSGCGGDSTSADSRVTNNVKGVKEILEEGIDSSSEAEGTEVVSQPETDAAANTSSLPETDAAANTSSLSETDATANTSSLSETDAAANTSSLSETDATANTPSLPGTDVGTESTTSSGIEAKTDESGDASGTSENVDVDLTILPSNIVYSEVYNMMCAPSGYVGKTIRMDGRFTVYHDDATGNDYFACINQDAAACCSQGMEFVLKGENKYPEDYPEMGDLIEVQGVFGSYMENDFEYYALMDATMVEKDSTEQ